MKKLVVVLIGVQFGLFASSCVHNNNTSKALIGNWLATHSNDAIVNAKHKTSWEFYQERIKITMADGEKIYVMEGKYILDTKSNPWKIDITDLELKTPNPKHIVFSKRTKGILVFENDQLIIELNENDNIDTYPTNFAKEPGKEKMIFRRQ